MSQEQPDRRGRSAEQVSRQIAEDTSPGLRNSDIVASIGTSQKAVRDFIVDTNNWFEVVDVRVYRDDSVGIPCRYRWTIKRWVQNDMDSWLKDNGWVLAPHRRADSKEHEDNYMEARYKKQYGDITVYANFWVEFTEDVFDALQKGNAIKAAKQNRERSKKIDRLRGLKRGGN
jgi:hypothetical protein